MSYDEVYEKVKRDIEVQMALKRIEDKVDAIGEFILSKTTEGKSDDNEALKFLTGLFGHAIKQKAAAGTTAAASKGFASL